MGAAADCVPGLGCQLPRPIHCVPVGVQAHAAEADPFSARQVAVALEAGLGQKKVLTS